MTVSKERLPDRMGMLAPDDMHGVDFALRVQVGLAV
jgi:mRNA-degrading endonuclease toxin of MazEF toxin-antitoxin module